MNPARKLARSTFYGMAVVGLLAWTAPAQAYRMIQATTTGRVTAGNLVTCNDPGGFVHWTAANVNWYHNTAGPGAGKAAALQAAMTAWTNVIGADYALTYAGTTAAGWTTDGQNTVMWSAGNGCTGGCLALTALVVQAGQVLVESDITFNTAYTWNTNGTDYDTQAVAAHEFGHSLGIHHTEITSIPRPTMYASYIGVDGRTLESDDQQALQCAQDRYGVLPIPTLTTQTGYCLGWVTVDWTPSAGATYYEVQRSTTSTFTSPLLIYSGPAASLFHDGGNGVRWYRARACNGTACSGYSNSGSAPYYPICL